MRTREALSLMELATMGVQGWRRTAARWALRARDGGAYLPTGYPLGYTYLIRPRPRRKGEPETKDDDMCHAVMCRTCGKMTWAGCGQHVEQVLRKVPAAQRCPGHPKEPKTGGGLLDRLLGRR